MTDEATLFPPVRTEDGRAQSEAIEVNAAWHCNINCQWCSHASPVSQRKFADPDIVAADLRSLARWMRVDHVRVLGGEPLLHPHIDALLAGARDSGVGTALRVLTNGLTLHEASTKFWELVDEVHVSVYPSTSRTVERHVEQLRTSAAEANTTVVLKYFDRFRIAYRAPDEDVTLTRRIYRTCQIANVWRCLTAENGRLYRCPQATHVHMTKEYEKYRSGHGGDFLEIARVGSAADIVDWMRDAGPLDSCRVCAGSAGVLKPHRQIIPTRPAEVEPPIDQGFLRILETTPSASNSCVSRDVTVWEAER